MNNVGGRPEVEWRSISDTIGVDLGLSLDRFLARSFANW